MGDRFVEDPEEADVVLTVDQMVLSIDQGALGVLRLSFKTRWVSKDGEELAAVAGDALPRNPTQTGPGHWEDTLTVALEQIIGGYGDIEESARNDRDADIDERIKQAAEAAAKAAVEAERARVREGPKSEDDGNEEESGPTPAPPMTL